MGLEDLTGPSKYISDLINTNPDGADPKNQGDDHIRGVKNVTLNTFPNITGEVSATQSELNTMDGITATTAELNIMDGVTATTAELNSISNKVGGGDLDAFDSGTAISFYQSVAPTGWTQDTTNTDAMLRVVDGAGGGSGGSDSPILMNKVPTHNHTASSSVNGAHVHDLYFGPAPPASLDCPTMEPNSPSNRSGFVPEAGNHAHTITVNNNAGSNWTPKYVDMIICVKD